MSAGKSRFSEVLNAGREAARSAGEVIGEFGEELRRPEERGRHARDGETVMGHLREAAQNVTERRSVDSLKEGAGQVLGAAGEAWGSLAGRVNRATDTARKSGAAAQAVRACQRMGDTVREAAREAIAGRETPGPRGRDAGQDIIDGEVLSETIHEEEPRRD